MIYYKYEIKERKNTSDCHLNHILSSAITEGRDHMIDLYFLALIIVIFSTIITIVIILSAIILIVYKFKSFIATLSQKINPTKQKVTERMFNYETDQEENNKHQQHLHNKQKAGEANQTCQKEDYKNRKR